MAKERPRLFKIIGLKVLDNCSEMLRKVLRPGEMYFFCNDYIEDGKGFVKLRPGVQELSEFFFKTNQINSPLVSISCIVGQNGDGKSSLIELMIRVLNNFAFCGGFLSDHNSLRFIPGICAKLFYRINDDICCIVCLERTVELLVNGQIVWFRDLDNHQDRSEWEYKISLKDYAPYFFYSLVSNYSLYAYNSEEFKMETADENEDHSWITALFYKNDAYQTPVNLSPMRTRGIIDVNREYELSMQRFGELFLNCGEGKFRISEKETVEGFAYKLETNSNLFTRTLRDFVLDEKRGARNVILFNKSFYRNHRKRKFALNTGEDSVVLENIKFWENFDHSFYDSGLLEIVKAIVLEKVKKDDAVSFNTDLSKYLAYMQTMAREVSVRASDNINGFLSQGGGMLTFQQFQRAFLVFEVYKRWVQFTPDVEFKRVNFVNMSHQEHALWYLLYKTIRVFDTYPEYFFGGLSDYELPQHFFNDDVRNNNLNKWFYALTEDIKEKTHKTLKIRQTLFYLHNYENAPFYKDRRRYSKPQRQVLNQIGFDHLVSVEEYFSYIQASSELAAAIPPPFFRIDYLVSRGGLELYPLSRMSSGERQLLNSASSIVYHIKNIQHSMPAKTKVVYENISVILEEVELYFHPEYQRQFVKYLLDQIANAYLSPKLAINFIIVTHSPFVLSDIPRSNVLFLRDGVTDRSMQEDTFGANIHTLLQSGFFLTSVPIGEFARDKINGMFAELNLSKEVPEESLSRLAKEIPLVSEPLLRGQLMKLYSQRKMFAGWDIMDYVNKLNELTEEISVLKTQLNDSSRSE